MLDVVNRQNKAGNTALHWAALNGHLDAVKVLLEQGADPTIKNARGHDAIYEAELNDKMEIVDWVLKNAGEGLEQGAGVNGNDAAGNGEGEIDEDEDMSSDNIDKAYIVGVDEKGAVEVVEGKGEGTGVVEELAQLKVEDEEKD
jgi:ankyrin repeat protein